MRNMFSLVFKTLCAKQGSKVERFSSLEERKIFYEPVNNFTKLLIKEILRPILGI